MARSALDEVSQSGAFVRTASEFRNFISRDPNSQFPAEAGRYHLYVSYACPWASRCLAYLNIKGLEKAISFTVSHCLLSYCLLSSHFWNYFFALSNCLLLCVVGQTYMGKNKRK